MNLFNILHRGKIIGQITAISRREACERYASIYQSAPDLCEIHAEEVK